MIVYALQPGPRGWSVLRNGQPLAQYTSASRALETARQMARRESECQGSQTEVRPITALKFASFAPA